MKRQDIAVVGMSCRFPGAGNVKDFWNLLLNKLNSITPMPVDRFEPASKNREMTPFWWGEIPNVDHFDHSFFSISPREAATMDPQQRLALEVSWEAMEDAGLTITEKIPQTIGVYVAIQHDDYQKLIHKEKNQTDVLTTIGGSRNGVSGRLSYAFNFNGPSLTIDSDRSSSLVAVHLACQALQSGECNVAIVGGANLILSTEVTEAFANSSMLAPDGVCKFGSRDANGFVRSEGVAFVVLKPLDKAIADGDRIYACIASSAVSHPGNSGGDLTTPSLSAQIEMLKRTCSSAQIDPSDLSFIEAHGTGTAVGDKIELGCYHEIMLQRKEPCLVGSVKTNIGHTEATAGLAGLIKACLSLKNNLVPASLNLKEPLPLLKQENSRILIPQEATSLPKQNDARYAMVNSLGLTGTMAQVVLKQAPNATVNLGETIDDSNADIAVAVLPLSARSPEALNLLIEKYLKVLEDPSISISTLQQNAALRRTHHQYRIAAVGRTAAELRSSLTLQAVPSSGRTDKSQTLATLYQQGVNVDWRSIFDHGCTPCDLPTYPWCHQQFWFTSTERSNKNKPIDQPHVKDDVDDKLLSEIKRVPRSLRLEMIRKAIKQQIADILSIEDKQQITGDISFKDLGLKSVLGIELRKKLSATFNISFHSSLLFNYPTLNTLSEHLNEVIDSTTKNIGDILVENKATTTAEIQAAAREQKSSKKEKLGEILVRRGAITPADLKHALHQQLNEPIAIVGMACRFPNSDNPESFWENLIGAKDLIVEVPPHRWDKDKFYSPDPNTEGKMNTKFGGFLKDVDAFDAAFFGIAPREARLMDPQQRLFLEVAWEALENAAISPHDLSGSKTGVFLGMMNHDDYGDLKRLFEHPEKVDAHDSTGDSMAVAAGRLSYFLNLRGPCLTLDTACSSSLVAIHIATQSLRMDECTAAIVGGVNLILSPVTTLSFSQSSMMAPDGRCKTFDETANGYVRGEGCGVVILKRLSKAIENKDNILALICGSAINQDGKTSGLTAPSGLAQKEVIEEALNSASLPPTAISYVEAHGTGTALGDPIEVKALTEVYGEGRPPSEPLIIGSVKTNHGHLEAAAGISGLIKVVLSMQHNQIPPHLHLKNLNTRIEDERKLIRVPTEPLAWPSSQKEKIAGVSSFGFSGTNAHIIVKEPPTDSTVREQISPKFSIFCLSSQTPQALSNLVKRYINYLEKTQSPITQICATAATGRSHFRYRLAFFCHSVMDLKSQLSHWLSQTHSVPAPPREIPEVAFVFGHSSELRGSIGSILGELYDSEPVFCTAIDECDSSIRSLAMSSEFLHSAVDLKTERETQILDFCFQYALARFFLSCGLQPTLVSGRDASELAGHAAMGMLPLTQALKNFLADNRSEVIGRPPVNQMNLSQNQLDVFHATVRRLIEQGPLGLYAILASLYTKGYDLNWKGYYEPYSIRKLNDLPKYPFEKSRFWIKDFGITNDQPSHQVLHKNDGKVDKDEKTVTQAVSGIELSQILQMTDSETLKAFRSGRRFD